MTAKVLKSLSGVAKGALSLFTGGAGGWSWLLWLGLGASTVGGGVWWHSGAVDDAAEAARAAGAAGVQQQWDQAENAALRESQREVSRLVAVNLEVQRDLDLAKTAVSDMALARARSAGLRESERAAIVAAAERVASGACGRYAAAAERDIEGVEDDATAMGQRAAQASAVAHALRRTIDERRSALDARREAMKTTTKQE